MNRQANREEFGLGDYLALVRARWAWLAFPIVLFPLLAALYSSAQPLTYSARARVLLTTSAAQEAVASRININTELFDRDLVNEINIANSDVVVELVRQKLELPDDDTLSDGLVTASAEADVLNFDFEGTTPEEAALFANTWAEAYVEQKQADAQASIDRAVVQFDERLGALRVERAEVRAELERLEDRLVQASDESARQSLQLRVDREASAISGDLGLIDGQIAANIDGITQLQLSSELSGSAELVSAAVPPVDSDNAPLSRNIVVAVFIGGLVGLGLALLVDSLDRSISGSEDLQRMGLTVLGQVPIAPRRMTEQTLSTIAHTQPGTPIADGYQKVRTALQFTTLEADIKTILVTSPKHGDGKTTTAVNLALAYANVENRVVLADVDFRRPHIHTVFNTNLIPGISDALLGFATLNQLAVSHPELSTTLLAAPAGTQPPNPAAFLSSSLVADLLDELRTQADLTILDAPPVLPVADALSVASHADGVILVVRAGETKRDDLESAVESITRSGGRLLGVVLNRVKGKNSSYAYPRQRWSGQRGGINSDRSDDEPILQDSSANGSPVVSSSQPLADGETRRTRQ